ncbi:MAG: hypothetical protein EP329_16845 [Deltaproteobacteria bacterium]|nr:MAG: hypothetical protein EP329_16845 [Deltaproteobacteria bacterium]
MTQTSAATFELSLFTLNTWGFRWPLARHRKRRFARIASHLAETTYDVVALQELWDAAPPVLGPTGLVWARQATGTPLGRPHGFNHSGLGVKLHPTLAPGARLVTRLITAFREHRGWDRVKTKGAFAVDVPFGDDGRVTVLTTHLQAGRRHGRIRRGQVDQILEAAADIPGPMVLAGDFNFFDDSPEDRASHRVLAEAGFRDAGELLERPEPTYLVANPYAGKGDGDQRFDRIYLRDGAEHRLTARDLRVIVDHAEPMSDHQALAANLVISRI